MALMDPCHRRRPRLEFIRSSAAASAQTVDDLHTRPVEPPVDVALLGGTVVRVATKDKLQVLLSPFSRPGPALPISACIRGVAGLSCARPRAVTGATASQSIHFLELIIQARARNRRHARLLMDRGVEWLVRESYFSSLVRAEHALTALGIEAIRLADNIAVVRAWCEENVARVRVILRWQAPIDLGRAAASRTLPHIVLHDVCGARLLRRPRVPRVQE
jgi:hypothetical protein